MQDEAGRRLAPGALSTTLTLGAMTAMVPLATDIYLPAMPAMAIDLASSVAKTQLTLSVFMIGFALGQMFYGPISDRVGRRPAILFGFALFAAGSIACTFAPNMDALLVARVVQAVGGAGPVVLARAVARDLYDGPDVGRELSRMAAIMGLTPAVAPIIGAGLLAVAGWRSNFAFVAAVAVVFGAYAFWALPETIRARRAEPLTLSSIFGGYGELFAAPVFRISMAINALAFAGLFAFISVGSFILQGVYGLSEKGFAAVFGAGCLFFVAGSTISAHLMKRYGVVRSIAIGTSLLALGGVGMLIGALASPSPWALAGPMMLYWIGIGFTLPASMAAALTPFGHRAGAASSALGVAQTTFGAGVGAALGHSLSGSALPLPIATACTGLGALLVFALTLKARRAG
jgi:DHA1 family bicyclomycin/chloramphenicol resistance-like MFS transporter